MLPAACTGVIDEGSFLFGNDYYPPFEHSVGPTIDHKGQDLFLQSFAFLGLRSIAYTNRT